MNRLFLRRRDVHEWLGSLGFSRHVINEALSGSVPKHVLRPGGRAYYRREDIEAAFQIKQYEQEQ